MTTRPLLDGSYREMGIDQWTGYQYGAAKIVPCHKSNDFGRQGGSRVTGGDGDRSRGWQAKSNREGPSTRSTARPDGTKRMAKRKSDLAIIVRRSQLFRYE